LEKEVQYLSQR